MFAELGDSTALSQTLELEQLHAVNKTYQSVVAEAIAASTSNDARYLGDDLLAYFGYSQAHAGDVEHTVESLIRSASTVPIVRHQACICCGQVLLSRL
jgi:class 3 adenylate cyclase